MKYIALALTGMAGGLIISAGIFALITSTKLLSRLAAKTHTGKYARVYEECVILGGIIFNVIYIKEMNLTELISETVFGTYIAIALVILFALFAGIFVGCLAVALAEALKATAVFSRRIKLRYGMGYIIFAVAIGKMTGSLIQFFVMDK
jgi:stage V sporulation protein AB